MSTSTLVGAGGLGLIVANAATGPQRAALAPVWTGSGDLAGAHTAAKQIGVEALAVGALVLVSGQSRAASRCLTGDPRLSVAAVDRSHRRGAAATGALGAPRPRSPAPAAGPPASPPAPAR
jgi:hypothetical protein